MPVYQFPRAAIQSTINWVAYKQKFVVSQVWRQEVQDQAISGVGFFLRAVRLSRPWLFSFKSHSFSAVLGLPCCMGFFSSCGRRGLFSSCGAWASHCKGTSWCSAWALGCAAFSSCRSQALKAEAQWLWLTSLVAPQRQDPPRPGAELLPPALVGKFFATEPPGMAPHLSFSFWEPQASLGLWVAAFSACLRIVFPLTSPSSILSFYKNTDHNRLEPTLRISF